jgi:hypothetical protein
MLVFSAPINNKVHKIVHFQFRDGLANKNTQEFYPNSSPFTEVIALRPAIWYWWKQMLQRVSRELDWFTYEEGLDLVPLTEE